MHVLVLEMQEGHTKCTLNIAHSRVKQHCCFIPKQNTKSAGFQEWSVSALVPSQYAAFLKNNIRSRVHFRSPMRMTRIIRLCSKKRVEAHFVYLRITNRRPLILEPRAMKIKKKMPASSSTQPVPKSSSFWTFR